MTRFSSTKNKECVVFTYEKQVTPRTWKVISVAVVHVKDKEKK